MPNSFFMKLEHFFAKTYEEQDIWSTYFEIKDGNTIRPNLTTPPVRANTTKPSMNSRCMVTAMIALAGSARAH